MQRRVIIFGVLLAACGLGACQGYDFIFQPNADRSGAHLRFVVETPSKADILFVIDNSISMAEEQAALMDSVGVLLESLAPQDTRYRIGVVSSDTLGFSSNCGGVEEEFVRREYPGARGDCLRPDMVLRRPHDGAAGRLMAAYVPEVFDLAHPQNHLFDDLTPEQRAVVAQLLPTSAYTHPAEFDAFAGFKGEAGARWVIDRETIKLETCQACGCTLGTGLATTCAEESACYDACVQELAPRVVAAYFRANVMALGIGGQSYEQGLKAATLAVGIDIEDPNDETALLPARDWTALPDGPNTFRTRDATGVPATSMWLREEALLAVMVVSDEEDCSMPAAIWDKHCAFEQGCPGWSPPPGWTAQPVGSLCYQDEVHAQLIDTSRVAQLVVTKKGSSVSRVAVGFIGGVEQQNGEARLGRATDCAVDPLTLAPTSTCSCLAAPWVFPDEQAECDAWCAYTQVDDGECVDCAQFLTEPACASADCTWAATECLPGVPSSTCDAMAGSRYVDFADLFRRRTYDSVCKAGNEGFGEAMANFAQIATLACFELVGVSPAGIPPNADFIVVKRAARDEAAEGSEPTVLPRQESTANEEGWYFDFEDNVPRICLTGLDRLVGDVYDIFILTRDELDFTR